MFNFLSDTGLLPNYAFPEEGIVLKAVLTRVEKDEHDKEKNKYESTTYEYNRSASTAISEFAPFSFCCDDFPSQQKKVVTYLFHHKME